MKNLEVSEIFRDIVRILQIKGDNPFRIRAYERAAANIEGLSEDIENFIKEDRLTRIPGIGTDLSNKIKEFTKTGRIKFFEQLKKSIPAGLLELLKVPSIGPKTAKILHEQLKIKNLSDLEKSIKAGKLVGIFGIKEKTVENILKGIELFKRGRERMPLAVAIQVADEFIGVLKRSSAVKKISTAGSLRRQKEAVRDIDILAVSNKPQKIMDAFVEMPQVQEVLAKGKTKSSVRTRGDVQIDCRVVEEKSFGAALMYFTGSKNFNIKLRELAARRNLKINEYGVFSVVTRGGSGKKHGEKRDRFLAGKTEEEIFRLLDMSYIPPELREDSGEIELARGFKLPQLITLQDLKGDLHVHSRWSDGGNTIEEIVRACQGRGYSYVLVTDHSEGLKIAGGLGRSDVKKKRREIDKINKRLRGFRVLCGTEVDIDSQGNLDYQDELLKEFDIVVAAIHTGFKQSRAQLTKRLVKACQSKFVHIIAHPTGRLWGAREAYDLDLDEVFKVAAGTNTALEINAFPQRLDLSDLNCRRVKEMGARLAVSTDAHTIEQLDSVKFGISVARRGWLTRDDVINTLPLDELLKAIKK